MKKTGKFQKLLVVLGVYLVVLVAGYLIMRPWLLNWGAAPAEAAAVLPGDVKGPRWTRAVTIQGTPEQVWPWIVQWGQGRGGWYSYDWLENLFGLDIHTADIILVEHQNPTLGEKICMGKGFCVSKVAIIEPYRAFGWNALGEDDSVVWSFTFLLSPADNGATRLLMRESFDPAWMPAPALAALAIPDGIMAQKALDTVKNRVEGRPDSSLTIVMEIGAWLAAFVAAIYALLCSVTSPAWVRPLLVGVLAVIVLLVITFLFLPLWLRVLLAIALAGGVGWLARQRCQAQDGLSAFREQNYPRSAL